jgi:hypothetical protein
MAQKIKVYRIGDRGLKFEEVNIDEAERLLEEAHARGSVVLNKKESEVISKIAPDIEELLIVNVIAGG